MITNKGFWLLYIIIKIESYSFVVVVFNKKSDFGQFGPKTLVYHFHRHCKYWCYSLVLTWINIHTNHKSQQLLMLYQPVEMEYQLQCHQKPAAVEQPGHEPGKGALHHSWAEPFCRRAAWGLWWWDGPTAVTPALCIHTLQVRVSTTHYSVVLWWWEG